jgi:hypothetical protein
LNPCGNGYLSLFIFKELINFRYLSAMFLQHLPGGDCGGDAGRRRPPGKGRTYALTIVAISTAFVVLRQRIWIPPRFIENPEAPPREQGVRSARLAGGLFTVEQQKL